MRQVGDAFRAHLSSGITTIASCWIIRRKDDVCLGFTDHDRPIDLNGVHCEPESGLSGSDIRQSEGFASDDQDVAGVLSSLRISEDDLMSRRYDAATIETWKVNWQDPEQAVLLRTGYIGEVKRDGLTFQAEIRGLSIELDQERGRVYQQTCDATLGDARCGINLGDPAYHAVGLIVDKASATELRIDMSVVPNDGHFAMGQIAFETGAAKGMVGDVLSHVRQGSLDRIELWQPMHAGVAIGDQVRITVGCDKCFATCRDRFVNQLNFRGFPHIPGNDFILSFPGQGKYRDGSPLMGD